MESLEENSESVFPIFSLNEKPSEAQQLREKNIKERDAFFASLLKDPEFAEAVEAINSSYKEKPNNISGTKSKVKRRSGKVRDDEPFRFFGRIPSEHRRSSRLQNMAPEYTEGDLIDETVIKRRETLGGFHDNFDYEDIEEVVFIPNRKSKSVKRSSTIRHIIPAEEVTEEMLSQVLYRVSEKVYSDRGSSCHQCRQKTNDQKTCCRNEECIGVRGQFCGVCLFNRYGEDAIKALKDPNWHCPVCRGICNCSFCRAKEGKRPTGILAPLAQRYGHKSVKDFLDSLRGEGDYADETKDPKKLIGFSNDLSFAHMGGEVTFKFDILCNPQKFANYSEQLEKKLVSCKPYESIHLLGFQDNTAKFDNGEMELNCECCNLQKPVICERYVFS